MLNSPLKPVEIYRARDLPEAHAIRLALEEAGIGVRIDGELLQGAVGELPLGWDTAPRILVEEAQVGQAQAIIERAASRKSAQPNESADVTRCLACGTLMDDAASTCPACGWSFEEPAKARAEH